MAFPSNSTVSLAGRWAQIKAVSGILKDQCTQLIAAASITRSRALFLLNILADRLAELDNATANAANNGLLSYAQAQENNPSLDLVATYSAMKTQLIALQDWLVANFPRDANGDAAVFAINGGKRYAEIPLTAGQLSAFKAQLTSLSTTID